MIQMEENTKSNGWSDIVGTDSISNNTDTETQIVDSKSPVEGTPTTVEQPVVKKKYEKKAEKKDKELVKEEKKPEGRKRITPLIDRNNNVIKRLLCGGPSSGKTRAAIAHFYYNVLKKNKDAICWYIDTERGLKETLKEFPDDLDESLESFECNNFKGVIGALKLTLENSQQGDVIIVDMLTTVWSWAQENYTMQVFDEDISEFYMTRRKELLREKSGKGAFDGWKDWVGIKMLHNKDFIDELVRQTGAELISICSVKEVEMNDLEKNKMVDKPTIFTPVGFAPEGEKHNDHRFDRIIYFWRGVDNWYIKAPKWRGNTDLMLKRITVPKGEFPKI